MQKKKNRVIIALAAIIGFMAVGYALLSQELTINGTANIDSTWDVKITDITPGEFEGGASNSLDEGEEEILPSVSGDGLTATFSVDLTQPGDQGVYIITVTNNGTIPAKLMSAPDVTTINGEEPTEIQFNVSVLDDKMLLQPTETAQIAVVAAWPDTSSEIPEGEVSKTATITLNYQQATADDVGD